MLKQILQRIKQPAVRSFMTLAGACILLPGAVPGSPLSMTAYGESSPGEDREWSFTYFGTSTNEAQNRLLYSGTGIESDVSIASATFKEDGTVKKRAASL